MSYPQLVEYARALGVMRVVIVCRGLRGNPGRIVFLDTTSSSVSFYPLILKLKGVKLAREMGVKPTPPRNMVVAAPLTPDSVEFGQEVAGALNLDFVEGVGVEDLASTYDGVLVVEPVESRKAIYALKFVDPKSLRPRGPRLLIASYYLRRLRYGEV